MGQIKIEISGSFGIKSKKFSAQEHGHAEAVAEAIEWLSSEVLPQAIALDHRLHEQGKKPTHGFGVDTR